MDKIKLLTPALYLKYCFEPTLGAECQLLGAKVGRYICFGHYIIDYMICKKCGSNKVVKHGTKAFCDGIHQMHKCVACAHIQKSE